MGRFFQLRTQEGKLEEASRESLFIHRSELWVTVNQPEVEQGGNFTRREVLEAKPEAGTWGKVGFAFRQEQWPLKGPEKDDKEGSGTQGALSTEDCEHQVSKNSLLS